MTDDRVSELRALHVGRATLADPDTDGLPAGWSVVVRTWGRRLCDALVIPPRPYSGWRTAGDLTTADKARQRATDEIHRALVDPPRWAVPDFDKLAAYNAERARGLVHTTEWDERMAQAQAEFDRWSGGGASSEANGG